MTNTALTWTWGKPTLSLMCGDCDEQMEPGELPTEGEAS